MTNELLIIAVVPVVILLVYIYRKDPVEKEPGKLLALLLMWGVLAIIPVMLLEGGGIYLLQNVPLNDWGFLLIENFFVIALNAQCNVLGARRISTAWPIIASSGDSAFGMVSVFPSETYLERAIE